MNQVYEQEWKEKIFDEQNKGIESSSEVIWCDIITSDWHSQVTTTEIQVSPSDTSSSISSEEDDMIEDVNDEVDDMQQWNNIIYYTSFIPSFSTWFSKDVLNLIMTEY